MNEEGYRITGASRTRREGEKRDDGGKERRAKRDSIILGRTIDRPFVQDKIERQEPEEKREPRTLHRVWEWRGDRVFRSTYGRGLKLSTDGTVARRHVASTRATARSGGGGASSSLVVLARRLRYGAGLTEGWGWQQRRASRRAAGATLRACVHPRVCARVAPHLASQILRRKIFVRQGNHLLRERAASISRRSCHRFWNVTNKCGKYSVFYWKIRKRRKCFFF